MPVRFEINENDAARFDRLVGESLEIPSNATARIVTKRGALSDGRSAAVIACEVKLPGGRHAVVAIPASVSLLRAVLRTLPDEGEERVTAYSATGKTIGGLP